MISVMLSSAASLALGAAEGGGLLATGMIPGGPINSFSWMIRPPLFEVFSTCRATDMPCSFFPKPCPSLKPYFCMIFAATLEPP